MFRMRIVELPLPTSQRDTDSLVAWLIEAFALIRRQGPASADGGTASPVHRLLRHHILLHPTHAWDAGSLADELGLTAASLNHHLGRLVEAGLLGYTDEGKGWRRYYLQGGSLRAAVARVKVNAVLVTSQRLAVLNDAWTRIGEAMEVDMPDDAPLPLHLGVADRRPPSLESGADDLTLWMADAGLMGDRPGKEIRVGSATHRLFLMLLDRDLPLSNDEAAEVLDIPTARVGRLLERFRATGVVERVPRTDRLPTSLWSAMVSQHERRGPEWLLTKGGFQRLLSDANQNALISALDKGSLRPEDVAAHVASLSVDDSMLLLNLLGGRLALGHRLAGSTPDRLERHLLERLERALRRVERVAELVEESILQD
jgi:predicted ArsR family transcriptional regulator